MRVGKPTTFPVVVREVLSNGKEVERVEVCDRSSLSHYHTELAMRNRRHGGGNGFICSAEVSNEIPVVRRRWKSFRSHTDLPVAPLGHGALMTLQPSHD